MYPDYDYDESQGRYSFPHRQRGYDFGDDGYYDSDSYLDNMNFTSMDEYANFMLWGTDTNDDVYN